MPQSKTTPAKWLQEEHVIPGFDVTCVIGHVEFDTLAEQSATETAFRLIGRHNADGKYTFPAEHGGIVTVFVETKLAERE